MLVWDLAVPHRTRPLQQHAAAFPDRGTTTYHGRVQSFHLRCTPAEDRGGDCPAAAGQRGAKDQKVWRPSVQALLAVRHHHPPPRCRQACSHPLRARDDASREETDSAA